MKRAILINDTSTKSHLGCRIVVARIVELAAENDLEIGITSSVHTDWRLHEDLKDAMRAADLVIVNGEGTLHDSSRAARALAAVGPYCRDAQVPAVLINSVFENNDASLAEDCRSFERIFVRESVSAAFAREHGLRAEVVPDLTLSSHAMVQFAGVDRHDCILMTDNANRSVAGRAIDVAVSRSDVRFINLNTHDPRARFMPETNGPIEVFIKSGRVDTLKYNTRSGWMRGLQAPFLNLSHPIRRILAMRDLKKTRLAGEILREIATCRGLVAGRFHAMCLSLLADTPFAAMQSNTLKTKGLLADAGLVHRLAEDSVEALRLAPNWSDGERELAARFVSRARADASAMFRDIASLAR